MPKKAKAVKEQTKRINKLKKQEKAALPFVDWLQYMLWDENVDAHQLDDDHAVIEIKYNKERYIVSITKV